LSDRTVTVVSGLVAVPGSSGGDPGFITSGHESSSGGSFFPKLIRNMIGTGELLAYRSGGEFWIREEDLIPVWIGAGLIRLLVHRRSELSLLPVIGILRENLFLSLLIVSDGFLSG
jgi:hypothetical protein